MCGTDGELFPSGRAYRTPACLKAVPPDAAAEGDLVVEEFPLVYEGYTFPHSRIAYIKGRPPAPVVIVHHNYAGLKQFDIDQACFFARIGYVGLALDSYKEVLGYEYADRSPSQDEGCEESLEDFGRGARAARRRGLMGAYLDAALAHPTVCSGLAVSAASGSTDGDALLEQLLATRAPERCSKRRRLLIRELDAQRWGLDVRSPSPPLEAECRRGIGSLAVPMPDMYERDAIEEWKELETDEQLPPQLSSLAEVFWPEDSDFEAFSGLASGASGSGDGVFPGLGSAIAKRYGNHQLFLLAPSAKRRRLLAW